MGLCASVDDRLSPTEKAAKSVADARSLALTQGMEKDHKADLRVNKLLLLGAGESGKSTLFKVCLLPFLQLHFLKVLTLSFSFLPQANDHDIQDRL